MSRQSCWTRNIRETATLGAHSMINGGESVRVWSTLWCAIPAAGTGATDHDQVTDGGWAVLREMLAPASTAFGQRFGSQTVRLLLAGNALHADIPLDGSGSGFLGLLLIMLGQTVGFPVPEGGAGKLAEAMRDRFLRYGE